MICIVVVVVFLFLRVVPWHTANNENIYFCVCNTQHCSQDTCTISLSGSECASLGEHGFNQESSLAEKEMEEAVSLLSLVPLVLNLVCHTVNHL